MTIHDSTNLLLSTTKLQAQRHRGAATHLDYLARELERVRDDANFPMETLAQLANYYGFCVLHSGAARTLLEMVNAAVADSDEAPPEEAQALIPLLEQQVRAAA